MAVKTVCDVCGSENEVERFTVNAAASCGLPKGTPWKCDIDLCRDHFETTVALFTEFMESVCKA